MGECRNFFAWLSLQNLTGEELRILLNLMSRLNFEAYVDVSQIEVARIMGLHKTRVSKAIKHLLELNILLSGPKNKQMKSYRLNLAAVSALSPGERRGAGCERQVEGIAAPKRTIAIDTKSVLSRINKRIVHP